MASLMAMPRLPGQSGSSRQHLAAVFGLVAGAGMHRRAPGVHEHPAIRLLLVADLDHVNVAFQPEQSAGQRQGRTPLARAGLGGEAFGAGDLVVIGLGDGGVGLVAAGGAGALVFVINVRRRLQRLFQPHRAQQRRGPPQRVDFADLVGNRDPPVGAHFLLDEVFREKWPAVPPATPAVWCPDAAAAAAVPENPPADCTIGWECPARAGRN